MYSLHFDTWHPENFICAYGEAMGAMLHQKQAKSRFVQKRLRIEMIACRCKSYIIPGEDGIAVVPFFSHRWRRRHCRLSHWRALMKTPTNIYRVLNIPTAMPRNGTNAHTSTHVMCGRHCRHALYEKKKMIVHYSINKMCGRHCRHAPLSK